MRFGWLAVVFALAGQAAPPGSPSPPDPRLIRVYVEAAADPRASGAAALRESARDIAAAVAGKKKTLAVVAAAADADLIVSVLDRSVETPRFVMGLDPRQTQPLARPAPSRVVTLRVLLKSGETALEFTNKRKPLEAQDGWAVAAGDIVGQIDKWAAAHKADLLRRRALKRP